MKRFILFVIILLILTPAKAAEQITNIRICTPEWEYYTQKDGTGLYHDLWNSVFQSAGIKVTILYAPFKRCEISVKNNSNKYDAYACGYPFSGVIVPNWHIGIDLLTVVYKKGTILKWNGQASLLNKRVAWENGFDFDKHGVISVNVKKHEFQKLEYALKMLSSNRLDFVVDYNLAIKKLVKNLNLSDQLEIAPDVIAGPKYYMIFSNTEKGKKLAQIWDKGMEQLHKSGELQKLYKKYEAPGY